MSCSNFNSCDTCSTSGYCHWCGDSLNGACYSQYNYLACVWSTPCEQLNNCLRKEPEFVGAGSRAVYLRLGLGLFSFWLCLFLSFYVYVLKPMKQKTTSKIKLESDPVEEGVETPLLQKESDNDDEIENPVRPNKKFNRLCSYIFGIGSVVLAVIVLLTIYFSPSAPDFSVCTSELDWSSIIHTFTEFDYDVQGKYIFQASIYNPNRVEMMLKSCNGVFKYKSTKIGTFSIDGKHLNIKTKSLVNNTRIVIPKGSIVDVLFIAELDVPVKQGLNIAREYHYTQDLTLEVETEVTAGVNFYNIVEKHIKFKLPDLVFQISDIEDKRCKCKKT